MTSPNPLDGAKMTENEIRSSMTSEQILLERKLTCEAINGAMAVGYLDTNPPPSDDHWLAPFWRVGRKQAELELLSASKPAAPMGWKLVPDDATQAMRDAGNRKLQELATEPGMGIADRAFYVYAAMLAASPAAPAQSGEAVAYYTDWAGERRYSRVPVEIHDEAGDLFFNDVCKPEDYWRPLYAAPQPTQPAEGGEKFPYQKTFDAIAAATSISGGHIAISVAKFKEAFGLTPAPSAVVLDDERAAFEAWYAREEETARAHMEGDDWRELDPDEIDNYLAAFRAGKQQARAASPQATCQTCNGHGMIGGPSYREPDEGGEPCPDCAAAPQPAAQAARSEAVGWFVQRSEFGPWVEVEQQEPGAVQLCRMAQTERALTQDLIKQIGLRYGVPQEDRIVFYGDNFTVFAESLILAVQPTSGGDRD